MNSGTQAKRRYRAQRLHGGIEQPARQTPIARDGAEHGARYHAEAEAGDDARQRRHDMARELTAARQFDNGGEQSGSVAAPTVRWTGRARR